MSSFPGSRPSSASMLPMLAFADRGWIALMAGGIDWVVWSLAASVPLGIMAAGVQVFGQQVLAFLLIIGPMVGVLIGVWRVTADEPGTPAVITWSLRNVLRATTAVSVVLAGAGMLLGSGSSPTLTPKSSGNSGDDLIEMLRQMEQPELSLGRMVGASEVLTLVSGIAGGVGLVLLLCWLRRLARRIPDAALVRETSIVVWGMACTGILLILMLVLLGLSLLLASTDLSGTLAGGSLLPGCGGIIGTLLFFGWTFRLLGQYRRRIRSVLLIREIPIARPVNEGPR